jgi:uncharacterized protein
MKKLTYLFLTIIVLPIWAQRNKKNEDDKPIATPSEYHIGVIARNYGDSVVLRFAPQEAIFWKAAIKAGGFTVKRFNIKNGQTAETNQATVRPWALVDWKQRTKATDSMAAVCA